MSALVPMPIRLPLKQQLCCEMVVHLVAAPLRRRTRRETRDAGRVRVGVNRNGSVERFAIRFQEPKCTIVQNLNTPAAFVDKAMMEAAERDEIVEFCFAAARPVFDVMAIGVAFVTATRKTAPSIA